jgi:hypothetical protein
MVGKELCMKRSRMTLVSVILLVLAVSTFLGIKYPLIKTHAEAAYSVNPAVADLNLRLPWVYGNYGIHYGNSYNCPDHINRDAYAIDFALTDKPLDAVFSGRVYTGTMPSNSGYGNYILLDHGNGWIAIYAHLGDPNHTGFLVSNGQTVQQGQPIGYSGWSGNVDPPGIGGAHLHFVLRNNAFSQDNWSSANEIYNVGDPQIPEPMSGYTGFGNYGRCNNNAASPLYSAPAPGGWWISGPTPIGGKDDPKSSGTQINLEFQAHDNNNGGLSHVNFTQSSDNGKTWKILQNDYTQTVSNGDVHYFSHFFMPNSPVILSADVYSNNGSYQLAPYGLRYLCLSATQCPAELVTYNGPVNMSYGGGGDPNPTPTGPNDAIELCSGSNFTGDCERFTYPGSNDKCQSLDRMAGNSDSLRYLGNYPNNYHLDLYQDNGCSTFLSAVDHDSTDFGLSKNQYRAVKINYTSADGFQVCDGTNYSGNCQVYHWSDNNSCISLGDLAGHNKSVKFLGSYVKLYDANLFNDANCGKFQSVFFDDNPDIGWGLYNQYSSLKLIHHFPPDAPNNFRTTNSGANVKLEWDDSTFSKIHVWGTNYDLWKDWQSDRFVDLHSLSSGDYSVQVQSKNELGISPWSDVWTFTITDTSSSLAAKWTEPANNFFFYEPGQWYNMQMKLDASLDFDHLTFYGIWDDKWHNLCGDLSPADSGSYSCNTDFRGANNGVYPTGGNIWFEVIVTDKDGGLRTPTDGSRGGTYKTETFSSVWNSPADNFTVSSGDTLHLSAEAFPGNNNPPIDHVNFRVWYSGQQSWQTACANVGPGGDPHEYACDFDPASAGIPEGTQFVAAFDVFQVGDGQRLIAPDGNRTGTYAPTPTPSSSPTPSPTPSPTDTPTPSPTPIPNGFVAQYFANQTLSGTPKITRVDSSINFNWGYGSPDSSIPVDHFSARWTRTATFSQGTYQFTVTGDDGVRLFIDNKIVIDQWRVQAPTTYVTIQTLSQGIHQIKLEYYENAGGAVAKLSYQQVSIGSSFVGAYYANQTLSGTPTQMRLDSAVNFDYKTGSPMPTIPVDHFSVRWVQTATFTSGNYQFTVTSDDGVRLYIDGKLAINRWVNQAPTTNTAKVSLSGGTHQIKMEYYENTGGAVARLSYRKV